MGSWHTASWTRHVDAGVPRRDRRSGAYRWYEPDRLGDLALALPPELDRAVARAERNVQALGRSGSSNDLAGLARFLLRSEAIASSRIEGIAPAARQVAFAELAQDDEQVTKFSAQALLVARNMTLVREATSELSDADEITVGALERLHASLMADRPSEHGLRTVQNWIGGSDFHPIDADFVPPAPELVPRLMDDLLDYLNGAQHSPLVQAALVHAQFETIHPFTDGNGRVGRALIHTVLTRRGLTPTAVLPVSLVLATFRAEYIGSLTNFRSDPADSSIGVSAVLGWIETFVSAVEHAVGQAQRLAAEVEELRADWLHQLDSYRTEQGRTRAIRSDSATARILDDLPGTPVMTVRTVTRIHDVSPAAAAKALAELHGAGILRAPSAGRTRAYVVDEILDLVTKAERRLGSTRFDTRASPPHAGVPARPRG